jgi:hypothetical protein
MDTRKLGAAVSNTPRTITPHSTAAWLRATEVLLAEPEALGDDVLESCLYILRDRLQGRDVKDAYSRGLRQYPGGIIGRDHLIA